MPRRSRIGGIQLRQGVVARDVGGDRHEDGPEHVQDRTG